jgi:putative colanic acid biosynthesis UDP-glucose lipid carrier transferase
MSSIAAASAAESSLAASLTPRRRPSWSRQVAVDIVGFLDAAAVIGAGLLPGAIYAHAGGVAMSWGNIAKVGFITSMIVILCFKAWDMYDTEKMHEFPLHPGRIIAAVLIGLAAVLGLGIPFGSGQHLWMWYATWASGSSMLLLGNRMLARAVLARMTRAGRFDTRIAIFGAGSIARRVHDHLANPAPGLRFVGVYDDRTSKDRVNPEGLEIAGRMEDLVALGLDEGVDRIIIALPQSADGRIADIARKLEQLPCSVHVVTHISSDLIDAQTARSVSRLGPLGLLDVKGKPLADWAPFVKKIEDTLLGLAFLLVTLPIFALAAIAIRMEGNGPVFFRQRRRGLNQRVIEVLKFRTMNVMEDGDDVRQATAHDPRVTRVGRILRRTSLDELPQLLNVLKGEMSLVGPRPHALVHDEQFGEQLERYANRHQVKPGITGLAQVNGFRGETGTAEKMRRRVEYDLEYINNWSLGLDLKILARTFLAVSTGRNAH